jgi:hypothetical protein
MKTKLLFFILITIFVGCDSKTEPDLHTPLDKLFMNGFKLQLEQVYIMSNPALIPYVDKPTDSCFKSNTIIDIDKFYEYSDSAFKVFPIICKKEIWNFSSLKTQYDTTYQDLSYGPHYLIRMNVNETTYNIVTRENGYQKTKLLFPIQIGNPYNLHGYDSHVIGVYTYDSLKYKPNNTFKTNLHFKVVTNFKGMGIFSDYLYFDSNALMDLSISLTTPLTGIEVEKEIANGNYTLYLYNKMTTYKIGNNLYIPRYNSYVYVGCVNTNGRISISDVHYYRFKFKILK